MGLRGPAPKAPELARLDGYPDKGGGGPGKLKADRERYFAATESLDHVGEPPDDMSELAQAKWRELAREWYILLKQTDRDHLRLYCETWVDLIETQRLCDALGTTQFTEKGGERKSAHAMRLDTLRDQCRRMLNEFGATPTSRQRVDFKDPIERPKTKFGDLIN